MAGAADIGPELVEEILELLTKRGDTGKLGIIESSAAIDALLKVAAFLAAMGSPLQTPAERWAFADDAARYLNRQIIIFQELKRHGHFPNIQALPVEGLH